jgi:hypothetical protein
MPSLVLLARQLDKTPPAQLKQSPTPNLVTSFWDDFDAHQFDFAGKSQKYPESGVTPTENWPTPVRVNERYGDFATTIV